MCVAAAAVPAVTLAISAASTVASVGMGIYSAQQQAAQAQAQMNMAAQQQQLQQDQFRQSAIQQQEQQRQSNILAMRSKQQNVNLQIQQSNNNILTQYQQQVRGVNNERESLMSRHAADKLNYQRSKERADKQYDLNQEGLNTAYMQEQQKLGEIRQKAAFESQTALAKSIGAKGKILAAGRSGQSVGLLVNDVERQSGFKIAAENASVESAEAASSIAMQGAQNQADSANARAFSDVSWNPAAPYMPLMPDQPNFVDPIGLGIPLDNKPNV